MRRGVGLPVSLGSGRPRPYLRDCFSETRPMTEPFEPPDWLEQEDRFLAPYAMRTSQSRGRRHAEAAHAYRSLYQRDRDRIVHSTAFRRLMHKMQVLVTQTNDPHSRSCSD
jgi:hypothetical protein